MTQKKGLLELTTFESVDDALAFYFERSIVPQYFNSNNKTEETEKNLQERVSFVRKMAAMQYNEEEKI